MKRTEIEVGKTYVAKVSGKLVKVKVDAIRTVAKFKRSSYSSKSEYGDKTVYDVTNLSTARHITFHSAAKFRYEVLPVTAIPLESLIERRARIVKARQQGRCLTAEYAKRIDELTAEIDQRKITPKPNSTQFGAKQTGFPEDGGTVGGPSFLPELPRLGELCNSEQVKVIKDGYYCSKSPDGLHVFVFGTKAVKEGTCQYCGTDHINPKLTLGNGFEEQDLVGRLAKELNREEV